MPRSRAHACRSNWRAGGLRRALRLFQALAQFDLYSPLDLGLNRDIGFYFRLTLRLFVQRLALRLRLRTGLGLQMLANAPLDLLLHVLFRIDAFARLCFRLEPCSLLLRLTFCCG